MAVRFGLHYSPKAMSGKQAYFDHLRWKLKQQTRNRDALDSQLAGAQNIIANTMMSVSEASNEQAARQASARIQAAVQSKMAEKTDKTA